MRAISARPRRRITGTRPTVFLHSGWRTGSTYVWNKFRRLQGVVAYCEPFHEVHANLDIAQVSILSPNNWQSHHPVLDAPYFAEYTPLLQSEGGVRHFDPRLSYDWFFEPTGAALALQTLYISSLIDAARSNGLQPVLSFCRSTGRMAALRETFPEARHVLLLRNPRNQWSSCYDQHVKHGNPYFLAVHILVVAAASHARGEALRELLRIPDLSARALHESYDVCKDAATTMSPQENYRVFLHVYAETLDLSLPSCDLLLDMDRLTRSRSYLARSTLRLRSLTHRLINLRDANMPSYAPPATFDAVELEAQVIAERRALIALPGIDAPPGIGAAERLLSRL